MEIVLESIFGYSEIHEKHETSIAGALLLISGQDQNEACRESAISMLFEYFNHVNDTEKIQEKGEVRYDGYDLVTSFYEKFCTKFKDRISFDIYSIHESIDGNVSASSSFAENAEDVRLMFLLSAQELLSLIHMLGSNPNHHEAITECDSSQLKTILPLAPSSDICEAVSLAIKNDQNPDFKREACILIQRICKYVPDAIKIHAESLLMPLTSFSHDLDNAKTKQEYMLYSTSNSSLLNHRHSKLRLIALETGSCIISCVLDIIHEVRVEDAGFITQNPGSKGFLDIIEINVLPSWKNCVFDRVTSVRITLVQVVGSLLTKLIAIHGNQSNYPFYLSPLFIESGFILLSGICDNVTEVQNKALTELDYVSISLNNMRVCELISGMHPNLLSLILRRCNDWDTSKKINSLKVLSKSLTFLFEDKSTQRTTIETKYIKDIIMQLCECCIDSDEDEVINAVCKCGEKFALDERNVELALSISFSRLGYGPVSISGYTSSEHVAATLLVLSSILTGTKIHSTNLNDDLINGIFLALNSKIVLDSLKSSEVMKTVATVCVSLVDALPKMASMSPRDNVLVTNFLIICVHLLGRPDILGVHGDVDTALLDFSKKFDLTKQLDEDFCSGYILLSLNFHEVFQEITSRLNANSSNIEKGSLMALEALLRNSNSNIVCQHMDLVLPVMRSLLCEVSNYDLDYDEKISLLATLESVLSSQSQENSHLQIFAPRIIRELIHPYLVWKPGGKTAGARKLALACLFHLLKNTTTDGIIDTIPSLIPVLCTNLDDYDASTRQLSCLCLSLTFQLLPRILSEDVIRQVYPQLLKMLDDSSDDVRCIACKAISSFMKTCEPVYLEGTPIDVILEQLMVHLDDSNPLIQNSVMDVLFDARTIDNEAVRKHAQNSRLSHRSPILCDRLLQTK